MKIYYVCLRLTLVLTFLLPSLAYTQGRKQPIKRKRIVKKVHKVRIFRSLMDLLYLPKYRQLEVSGGVKFKNSVDTRDYLVSPLRQMQQVFSEEKKHTEAVGFATVNFSIMRDLVLGATIEGSFSDKTTGKSVKDTSSPFTQYDEENPGLKNPSLHGLYRLIHQREKGFSVDIFSALKIGVQSAQRAEGNYENSITSYRHDGVPQDFEKKGNAAEGGTGIILGVRGGRKHSPSFEYMFESKVSFMMSREYEMLNAYVYPSGAMSHLNYKEDPQFTFDLGGTGQLNLGDIAALYFGANLYFVGQRELNATYPNTWVERTTVESLTGFGARLGLKFHLLKSQFLLSLEGSYTTFGKAESITMVNNLESFRYQISERNIIGGKAQVTIIF